MLKPLEMNVMIKPIAKDKQTKAGIILTNTDKERAAISGEIVAIGEGSLKSDGSYTRPNVVIGDIVYFHARVPHEVEYEGEKYLIMNALDLLAKE